VRRPLRRVRPACAPTATRCTPCGAPADARAAAAWVVAGGLMMLTVPVTAWQARPCAACRTHLSRRLKRNTPARLSSPPCRYRFAVSCCASSNRGCASSPCASHGWCAALAARM
jgi:hypothetical protein